MSKRKPSGVMTKKQRAEVIEILTILREDIFWGVPIEIQREVVVRLAAVTCVLTAQHQGIAGMLAEADQLHKGIRTGIATAMNIPTMILPSANETKQ